ncbi:similar to mitochondrial F1F0-ATP synthase g subunit [Plenodomus lingam JN3]|uniref:Similar to mitochondrial F1F0-ATP synthase g subunit n=2 Tax=Leptosphaeria maculans TaxID=5022 RepID=E5A229_LEPMJ|nr:similar to mitochondrial F1F0-ATP synthase g subunit [Plenodomus lingam JN3]CBX97746.1 similar to mitochondrial F1F0-ATP synthase g subunit [Plenodomus lingam JN3]
MSLAASRAVLRQSNFIVRRAGIRNASSTSEAGGAVKDKAGQAASKASEGLSKVTSSASQVASSAAASANNAANATTGRVGKMVGFIQGIIPTATYYSKVGLELGKLIAHQRAMAPPSVQTMQSYMQPALNALKNPSSLLNRAATEANNAAQQPANLLAQVRNLSREQWISAGVVAAEVIGFFSVGEIIGRFKLVGYRSKEDTNH